MSKLELVSRWKWYVEERKETENLEVFMPANIAGFTEWCVIVLYGLNAV